MATVRQTRISKTKQAIIEGGLASKLKPNQVEGIAEDVVDALFPDHTFDHMEVGT